MSSREHKRKVFLSYAYADRPKIDYLKGILEANGFHVQNNDVIEAGQSWYDVISYELNASDFLILCLTKKLFNDGPFTFAYEQKLLEDAKKRDITIIPLILEDVELPNELRVYKSIDLRKDTENGIKFLLAKMLSMSSISFDSFTSEKFEELTFELLKTFDFVNIQREATKFDGGVDFMANMYQKDIFGKVKKEVWFVEAKFYRHERFSINILKNLTNRYQYVLRDNAKLLLVTNGLLTSVAREYLGELHQSDMLDIRVVDGNDLKEIIAENASLQSKFFTDEQPS